MGIWQKLFGPCECCEVLKETLAIERSLNRDLMQRLLPVIKSPDPSFINPIEQPKQQFIPWKVKRQMLEEQDRQKAKIMKQSGFASPVTEELEKELGIPE